MANNTKRKLVRVNTNITEELNEWLNEESARTGISKSAYILMALSQYKKQQDVMDQLPDLLEAMRKTQSLQQ